MASAESGHGGHGSVGLDDQTIKTMIYQALNVFILVAALVYGLKSTVKDFFKQKKEVFLSTAKKAQSLKQQAEEEHAQIKVQLTKLESSATESISRARADAAEMKQQLIIEAQALSKRIQEEAELAARLEVTRAKNQLREQMIQQASLLASDQIVQKVSAEDHRRLQGDFIQNVSEVRA